MARVNFKLGKLKPKHDERTLQFHKYFKVTEAAATELPYIPQTSHWPNAAPLGMLLNDQLGNCTIAAALHMKRLWAKANGVDFTPTDAMALAAYEAVGGYVPGNESTDNGCACLDVLNYYANTGIGGNKIHSYVQVDPSNHAHVQAASYLFGGLYIGINLPESAMHDPEGGWAVPAAGLTGEGTPGSAGGHCVDIAGYSQSELDTVTWGMRIPMTWAFWDAYVEECYALLSPDFALSNPSKATMFDMVQLEADLALVRA